MLHCNMRQRAARGSPWVMTTGLHASRMRPHACQPWVTVGHDRRVACGFSAAKPWVIAWAL